MASDERAADATAKAVQKATDEAEGKGYLGAAVDPTPNENYTIAGVTSGKATPETDRRAAKKAADRSAELSGQA